jgi:benzodiazapine receptor
MDWTLMAFIGICAVAASSGALFPPGRWYESLRKPSWRPPNWLFGPAWMVLYAMIAVSGWLVWTTTAPGERLVPMSVYGLQLVLNAVWSGIFFGMKRMKLALGEMALLWLSIAVNIAVFWPVHKDCSADARALSGVGVICLHAQPGACQAQPGLRQTGLGMMDYSAMKAVQFVLFFGAVFGFGFWQLYSLRKLRERRKQRR